MIDADIYFRKYDNYLKINYCLFIDFLYNFSLSYYLIYLIVNKLASYCLKYCIHKLIDI